mgnify:CR=1 FL=1
MENSFTQKLSGGEETARQFAYMEKAREYVAHLGEILGRKPTCCLLGQRRIGIDQIIIFLTFHSHFSINSISDHMGKQISKGVFPYFASLSIGLPS